MIMIPAGKEREKEMNSCSAPVGASNAQEKYLVAF